jgi:hypothetical protein
MDNLIDINEKLKRKKEIQQLQEELKKLIDSRPELAEYQKRIEEELRKAGDNPDNRLAIINNLFLEQKGRLFEALKQLKTELGNLKNAVEKREKE